MKKLLLFIFIGSTFSIYGNHKDLKQAIIKSNLVKVKEILKTTKLPKEEIPSLSNMAQNIVDRRRGDEKIAYIPEVIIGVPSAFASVVSLIATCGISISMLANSTEKKSPNDLSEIRAAFGTICIISTTLVYCSYKLFQLTHKWHDNAVEIKQLIESSASQ